MLLDFLHMRWFFCHQTPPDLFNFDPEKTGLKVDTKNYLGIDETAEKK